MSFVGEAISLPFGIFLTFFHQKGKVTKRNSFAFFMIVNDTILAENGALFGRKEVFNKINQK